MVEAVMAGVVRRRRIPRVDSVHADVAGLTSDIGAGPESDGWEIGSVHCDVVELLDLWNVQETSNMRRGRV